MSISDFYIKIGNGKRDHNGCMRMNYTLYQCGQVVKTGKGWGVDGAWNSATKAMKRLIAKEKNNV